MYHHVNFILILHVYISRCLVVTQARAFKNEMDRLPVDRTLITVGLHELPAMSKMRHQTWSRTQPAVAGISHNDADLDKHTGCGYKHEAYDMQLQCEG